MNPTITRRGFIAQAAGYIAASGVFQLDTLSEFIPAVMAKHGVPGLSFAAITNSEVTVRSFGVKNAMTLEPVEADTVFAAGSLTKPLFAYALLGLVEQKLLALDEPLGPFLPGELIGMEPKLRLVTTRMLLSHSSGIMSPISSPTFDFQPGERFAYSPAGYQLLQLMVERVTGQPLAAFVQANALGPLGMNNSSLEWTDRLKSSAAFGHFDTGVPRANRFERPPSAAASLLTTAGDYARFAVEMLRPGGRKTEMLKPQVPVADGVEWGLGWGLERMISGWSFWHWGDQDIFWSFALVDIRRRAGVVFLTNSRNGFKTFNEIVEHVLGGSRPSLSWVVKYLP